MAWIESHTVLSRHRKVKETARALRIRPAYLIGHLHLLWHAALEQAEDGDLTRWTDEFIAEAADFPGDAPQFVQLLQDHGWLEKNRLLHDWIDYAGKFLMGKYAKDHRDRLVEIWAKHGRVYGKKPPIPIPSDSQLDPNQTPRTPLGEVGRSSDPNLPGGDARGGAFKLEVRSEEAVALAAERRMAQPMTRQPFVPADGRPTATILVSGDSAEVRAIIDAYPKTREVDGRRSSIRVTLPDYDRVAIFLNRNPSYPLLRAVTLLAQATKAPPDLATFLAEPWTMDSLEAAGKGKPKGSAAKVDDFALNYKPPEDDAL
jgi:hypothetical protein